MGEVRKSKADNICKILFVAFVLASLLSLCSCANNSNSVNPQNEKAHQVYQAVIEQYKQALAEYNQTGQPYYFWNKAQEKYPYVNTADCNIPNGYSFVDLDQDGIDELITKCDDYQLISVFSCIDDKPCEVLHFWARSRGSLRQNNVICENGSGGASYGGNAYGNLCVTNPASNLSTDNLKVLDSFTWDGMDQYNSSKRQELEDKYPLDTSINWISL